jgi:AcrR family transcriptional regulator
MVEAIGERGYTETNVREVISRAGISRKTFYELYASKDDCLLAIYDETAQCMRGIVQRAYERGVTPQERIDAALDILVEWVAAEPELARLCVLETPTAGLAGRRRITATLTWLTGVMAEVLGDLDVPEMLPELIVGGIHQALSHRLVNDPSDLDGLTADLSEVWTWVERAGLERPAA